VLIEAAVHGLVADEAGAPVSDATVYLGTKETQTDDNGYFQISAGNSCDLLASCKSIMARWCS
jgi:hypothetical protein